MSRKIVKCFRSGSVGMGYIRCPPGRTSERHYGPSVGLLDLSVPGTCDPRTSVSFVLPSPSGTVGRAEAPSDPGDLERQRRRGLSTLGPSVGVVFDRRPTGLTCCGGPLGRKVLTQNVWYARDRYNWVSSVPWNFLPGAFLAGIPVFRRTVSR